MSLGIKVYQKLAGSLTKKTQGIVNKPTKPLFCEEYWKEAVQDRVVRQSERKSVSMHGLLNGINHHFINSPNPHHMDMKFMGVNKTPREMITETDWEFKSLAPLKEKLHTYRCIPQKPEFFAEYPKFQKSKAVKEGDTIIMREYAYATSDQSFAKCYLGDNGGIMYDITIGEGAKVSRRGILGTKDEIVFPRSSRFKCTKTENVETKDGSYLKVFLEYIIPKDKFFEVLKHNK